MELRHFAIRPSLNEHLLVRFVEIEDDLTAHGYLLTSQRRTSRARTCNLREQGPLRGSTSGVHDGLERQEEWLRFGRESPFASIERNETELLVEGHRVRLRIHNDPDAPELLTLFDCKSQDVSDQRTTDAHVLSAKVDAQPRESENRNWVGRQAVAKARTRNQVPLKRADGDRCEPDDATARNCNVRHRQPQLELVLTSVVSKEPVEVWLATREFAPIVFLGQRANLNVCRHASTPEGLPSARGVTRSTSPTDRTTSTPRRYGSE